MCELREPGETRRDRRIAQLEGQVRELQQALDAVCAELADADDTDTTEQER